MNTIKIKLRTDIEQRIRSIIPVNCTDDDMVWAAEWLIVMGLALVYVSLENHPGMTFGELYNMTVTYNSEIQ